MSLTLSDLLAPQTAEQAFAKMLAYLQANGFPVQSWQAGAPERAVLMAFATGLTAISSNYIPAIAGGGLLDYATGDWLRLLAKQRFNIDYNQATRTVGTIRLTNSGSASQTVNPSKMIFSFPSGNRYVGTLNSNVSISGSGGTLDITVASEFVNDSSKGYNYVDASNSQVNMVTPVPGVVATNPASTFSAVSLSGTSTGTVTPSGSPTISHQVTVRIDTSGQVTFASWSYSVDGSAYVSAGAVSSASIGGTGISVTLANGATTPSFIAGDTFIFATPGNWITTQGTDIETDDSLRERCKATFPDLSTAPTLRKYEKMARDASSQVTRVKVLADPSVNNKVNVVVAGQAGVLPAGVISTVQTYINFRTDLTDYVIVSSPIATPITLAGSVYVTASQLTTAQAAVQVAVSNYINSVGINGTIYWSKLLSTIQDCVGVVSVDRATLTINGSSNDLVLGTSTTFYIPSFTQTLSSALTWYQV